MKRLILIAAFILTAGTLAAQNYIIVNSEKVFKSIDAYNTAISDICHTRGYALRNIIITKVENLEREVA